MKLLVVCQLTAAVSFGQATKKIDHNTHTWISINGNTYINKHWFIMGDFHLRENGFFKSNNFVFGRVGLGYQVDPSLSFVVGYGNMLSAPAAAGWTTRPDENRLFEQVQLLTSYKKLKILQRLRNEQRWQTIIVDDHKTGENKFTNRVRYLLSLTLPVFKNPNLPQLAIADEVALQFGKAVVYNTFEQNRMFLGIKQKISKSVSFDAGYMRIFQQKSNGTGYNINDTYRLFFYYNLYPGLTKKA